MRKRILIEGLEPAAILSLPDEHVAALIAVGPIIFRAGSAQILGQVRMTSDRLIVELAQIDGGGEGVLPTIWSLADRLARQRGLRFVEWIVHAVNCAEPNLKLRRLLERRGFVVRHVDGVGLAYHLVHDVMQAKPNAIPMDSGGDLA